MSEFTNEDVSVVVCTKNSISGIGASLASLRESQVGELIVVDANSTDGTKNVALKYADTVLEDPGTGLGNARNIGIAQTTKPLILNWGSDNVLPPGELQKMIDYLVAGSFQGVSAQTRIPGSDYLSKSLNTWRAGRFFEGERAIIGTPTLFLGDLLRANLYDRTRVFSDDSELCERWSEEFGARFAISDAEVTEVGKTSWHEIKIRARMYGISDREVFQQGTNQGWGIARKTKSILHPLTSDFLTPILHMTFKEGVPAIPFLAAFTAVRYSAWVLAAFKKR